MQRPNTICSAISTVLATCSFSSISEAVRRSMAHSHTCIESWRWFLAWLFKTKCCMLGSRHGDENVLLPLPTCFLTGLLPSSSGWNDSLRTKIIWCSKPSNSFLFHRQGRSKALLWPLRLCVSTSHFLFIYSLLSFRLCSSTHTGLRLDPKYTIAEQVVVFSKLDCCHWCCLRASLLDIPLSGVPHTLLFACSFISLEFAP